MMSQAWDVETASTCLQSFFEETPMKKVLIAAAAVAVFASAANAGGIVTPEMPPVVIVQDTVGSSEGIFVPIMALLLLITLHHRS
jgi:ATP-dependent helicase YprA (DUF1998 family)